MQTLFLYKISTGARIKGGSKSGAGHSYVVFSSAKVMANAIVFLYVLGTEKGFSLLRYCFE